MWGYVVCAAVAVAAAGVGLLVRSRFWDAVRDDLAGWLRHAGLDRGALMDALVRLDALVVGIRRRLVARTQAEEIVIREDLLSVEQIDDPEVVAELRRRGHFEKSVLTLVEGG